MRGKRKHIFIVPIIAIALVCLGSYSVRADRFSGTSYKIDASVMNNFGNSSVSPSYAMTSSGGESIIGNGAGGSYLLSQGYSSQLNKSLQLSIQPSGLQAYYSFDETQGPTAYDWSVNANNAANNTGTNMTWVTGKKTRAIDQSLATGYLKSSTPPLNTVSSFTAEGWFNSNATTPGQVLFGQDDASGTGDKWNVSVNGSGGLTFYLQKAGVGVSAVSSTGLTDGAWRYVLVTYDGTTMKLYIHGSSSLPTLAAQQTNTAGSHTFTQPLTIGAQNVPATPQSFDGKIDEVRVYDRATPDNEVRNHYSAQNVFSNPGFVYVGDVTPGVSQAVLSDVVVQTDAPGYNLNASQFTYLTGDLYGDEILPISGTIATPDLWVEGLTKGFGFTLTSAPSLDPKWGTSPNYKYAATPDSSTTFYTRSGGYTGGTKDVIRMQYRLDTPASQVADYYQNLTVISGTMIP
jgi:hypothetical protein